MRLETRTFDRRVSNQYLLYDSCGRDTCDFFKTAASTLNKKIEAIGFEETLNNQCVERLLERL